MVVMSETVKSQVELEEVKELRMEMFAHELFVSKMAGQAEKH